MKRGGYAAFEDFAREESAKLLRTAYLLVRDRELAEDLLQTTLLRVFRRWDRAKEAPAAYAQRVLLNACRDSWRLQRRRPDEQAASAAEIAEGAPTTAGADVALGRLILLDALSALPVEHREIIVLRFFLDLSVLETAARLGIPEGTVKSATHRALHIMRSALLTQSET